MSFSFSWGWLRRFALGTASVSLLIGTCGMKKNPTTLMWEWPANRKPDARLAVRLDLLEEQGGGLFGIGKSPSIAENLPEPTRLAGEVLASNGNKPPAHSIELVVPRREIPGIARTDRVALGVVQSKTCICIEKIPADVANLDAWLAQWSCGGK